VSSASPLLIAAMTMKAVRASKTALRIVLRHEERQAALFLGGQ